MFMPSVHNKPPTSFLTHMRGAALVVLMLSLLAVALGVLAVAGEQVLAQHQLLALEHKRFSRQVASETLFEQEAAARQQMQVWDHSGLPIEGLESAGEASVVADGEGVERTLLATSVPTHCPHPKETQSQCWSVKVQQQGTGFARERMLIIPNTSCSQAYWYAPESRIYSDWLEPDAPIVPDEPPKRHPRVPKGV